MTIATETTALVAAMGSFGDALAAKLALAGGGTGSSIDWIEATATMTAADDDHIFADTSAGSFTINLPAVPVNGDSVTIKSGPAAATNMLTIGRNGNTIMGLAEDMDVTTNDTELTLVWVASDNTWRL